MTHEPDPTTCFDRFGVNAGFVEELYHHYLDAPSSVDDHWRTFFARFDAGASTVASDEGARQSHVASPQAVDRRAQTQEDDSQPLRGSAARTVENMEASLAVPTATSVRAVPARLLEINREKLNRELDRTGAGKVSFTHLIAYAVVRAVRDLPSLNVSYATRDGVPTLTHHKHLNLGLAVDVERRDGSRSLLVPCVRAADTMDFRTFWGAYEALIGKVRSGRAVPEDFIGTSATITNPGMIGTVHSVPRLMPGQGFILGVGKIGFPAEYEGADPTRLAEIGIGTVVTFTNTYDHRVITGASSGEFLGRLHDLLLGGGGFYDDVFTSLAVPTEPARWVVDRGAADGRGSREDKAIRVHALINMYRVRGHLIANLDPLPRTSPRTFSELDLTQHGLSIWDLDREFPVGSLGAGVLDRERMSLRDILQALRDAYARTIGVEYMHIQEPAQKAWIQGRVETPRPELTKQEQQRILERLSAAEAFERFMHTKFLGQKRFSLEGAETLVPMLDSLCTDAATAGTVEIVFGMAHRGRLNVLANIVGKSYEQIFREFEGELDPASTDGTGDVKYHLGARGEHVAPTGDAVTLTLAANPSHVEAVNPVVEGIARAKGDAIGDSMRRSILPLLVHGDAAFAGQGVVAETLNLSEVPGYEVGGTIHIVVNNQLGFTTAPELGRSGVYATDVAKMVQAPIFHVNADDPEAAVRVIRLAFEFRQRYAKDVVVDLVCYRRYGHNENDEPAFTQPAMYRLIEDHPPVRLLYRRQLLEQGVITVDEDEASEVAFRTRLEDAFAATRTAAPPTAQGAAWLDLGDAGDVPVPEEHLTTAVPQATLRQVVDAFARTPDGFDVHPKLERLLLARRAMFDKGEIDWALGEVLAFGSLLMEGVPVRLAGQDTRRGTFSQRHAVLVDQTNEEEYVPLAHVAEEQAPFMLYDTVLSEYAALGFEYGYSVASDALVCWEAQFGDFANGAQIVVDQFVVAASEKWGERSGLTMLLPHGYEGQGPEHTSARIERYLALCARNNIRVVYASTSAQFFHVLRHQVASQLRVPLVCFTPKRYLRMPQSRSPLSAFTAGRFEPVLGEPTRSLDGDTVTRVVLCSGKIGHELIEARDDADVATAVLRVEQLYPWPAEVLRKHVARYPNARELVWVQEEPSNMGAWRHVVERLRRIADERPVRLVARAASASPATGSLKVHELEQRELLRAALA